MDADLGAWQARLVTHFSALQRCRLGDRPIFALEHGLDQNEVQALSKVVRTHVVSSAPSPEHALPWIVYAAELGYGYSGDEYWQTFEDRTPGWTIHGSRYWIRDCYKSFQRQYGGAKPSGAWAEHFSIICWPITHAILPRDLQRQFARILYEVRHSFSAELFESPSKLGEFVAARSWNATSRFQNFAQETDLVGQIAAALLLQGGVGKESLIHPATLQRIGGDLDRERRAREWLRGARRFAQERAQIRGLALGRGPLPTTSRRPEDVRAEVAALGIEPRLILRPTDPEASSWEVYIEIPDLSHLLVRFPGTREVLTGSRCVVAGASGHPLARGRCLYGAQRVQLSRWPRSDEVLLRFDDMDPQFEYLLRSECLLRPGPTWLFRIASDGLAYESRSLRVRPGERYIVVRTSGPFDLTEHIKPLALNCQGIQAVILELPAALTRDWEETIRQLELRQAKTIEVWPAGLGAVVWDGEGYGEWLASERPCLAVCSDHPIAALLVTMRGGAELPLELTSLVPGEPIFVELPQLPVGLHSVRVFTRSSTIEEATPLGELDVVMRIREARPWSPGVSPHGPLIVQLEPSAPTLEQLWEGRVEVSLRGPLGRQVRCTISLHDSDHGPATFIKHLPSIALPIVPSGWRRHFEKHFQQTREGQLAYDSARFCEIEFKAEELGLFSVRCDREFNPLRWAVRRDGQQYIARLRDDSGDPSPPKTAQSGFERPCVEEPLPAASQYHVPSSGGMFVARRGEFTTAVIVSPMIRGLADLACAPQIDGRERSTDSLLRLLAAARTWGQARLSGDQFSAIRQRQVLSALTIHLFRLVGGETWASAELAAGSGDEGFNNLKLVVSKHREEAAIGAALASESAALASATCQDRVSRIASLMVTFHLIPYGISPGSTSRSIPSGRDKAGNPSDPEWLSEFALRLASDIADVEAWAGQQLRLGVSRILEAPTVARAARFLVIATDRHLQSRTAPGELYAGWAWK